jgi:predicted enzyme related to lactoylglutathione lyase
MPNWVVKNGPDGTPGISGGLMRRQHLLGGNEGAIASICTVAVDDLGKYVTGAVEPGGVVALPKMPVPGVGWLP